MATFSNAKPLLSTFPFNMTEYITKTPPRKPQAQWKLLKLCKIFFAKTHILPVQEVYHERDHPQVYHLTSDQEEPLKLKIDEAHPELKLWVTGYLDIMGPSDEDVPNDIFPDIRPKLYGCNLSNIRLFNMTFLKDDWKFLVAHSTLICLSLTKVTIKNDEGTILAFEDIIELLNPSELESVVINTPLPSIYTSQTFAKLSTAFPKLRRLSLYSINCELNLEGMAQLIKNQSTAEYFFNFEIGYPGESKALFDNQLRELTEGTGAIIEIF